MSCNILECYTCNKKDKDKCSCRQDINISIAMGISYISTLIKLHNLLIKEQISEKDHKRYCDILVYKLRYKYRPILLRERHIYEPSDDEIEEGKQRLATRIREVWAESKTDEFNVADCLFIENIINFNYLERLLIPPTKYRSIIIRYMIDSRFWYLKEERKMEVKKNQNTSRVTPVSPVDQMRQQHDMLRHFSWMYQHTLYGVNPSVPTNEKLQEFADHMRSYCESQGWDYDEIMKQKRGSINK